MTVEKLIFFLKIWCQRIISKEHIEIELFLSKLAAYFTITVEFLQCWSRAYLLRARFAGHWHVTITISLDLSSFYIHPSFHYIFLSTLLTACPSYGYILKGICSHSLCVCVLLREFEFLSDYMKIITYASLAIKSANFFEFSWYLGICFVKIIIKLFIRAKPSLVSTFFPAFWYNFDSLYIFDSRMSIKRKSSKYNKVFFSAAAETMIWIIKMLTLLLRERNKFRVATVQYPICLWNSGEIFWVYVFFDWKIIIVEIRFSGMQV